MGDVFQRELVVSKPSMDTSMVYKLQKCTDVSRSGICPRRADRMKTLSGSKEGL
jgi:hypothetical protein